MMLLLLNALKYLTQQGQIIMELNHKINILKLEMKGNEAVNAVMCSRKKHKPSLQQKQEIT